MADRIILQYSTSTALVSGMIRRLCHSEFSHVDAVLPDGNLLGASDQGEHGPVIAGNPQGVAIRPPDYQLFGIRRRMVIATPYADAIIACAMAELGKPFDNSALHIFLDDYLVSPRKVVRDWRNLSHWFCSELWAHGFETGGYWGLLKFTVDKDLIGPRDLHMVFEFDPNVVNRETWRTHPIEGLKLGTHEK